MRGLSTAAFWSEVGKSRYLIRLNVILDFELNWPLVVRRHLAEWQVISTTFVRQNDRQDLLYSKLRTVMIILIFVRGHNHVSEI